MNQAAVLAELHLGGYDILRITGTFDIKLQINAFCGLNLYD